MPVVGDIVGQCSATIAQEYDIFDTSSIRRRPTVRPRPMDSFTPALGDMMQVRYRTNSDPHQPHRPPVKRQR